MNKIILSILTFFIIITAAHSVEIPSPIYVLNKSGSVAAIENTEQNIKTNQFNLGKTYKFTYGGELHTDTNSTTTMLISDFMAISIHESSDFRFHANTVDVEFSTAPSKLNSKNKYNSFSLLSGSVDILNSSTNGITVIQTPRVVVNLKRGMFRVIVQGKITIVVVYEGIAVLNKVVEGKELILNPKTFAHVTTYVSLLNKGVDVLNNGMPTANVKDIPNGELLKFSEIHSELNKFLDSVFFADIDGIIVGIKK